MSSKGGTNASSQLGWDDRQPSTSRKHVTKTESISSVFFANTVYGRDWKRATLIGVLCSFFHLRLWIKGEQHMIWCVCAHACVFLLLALPPCWGVKIGVSTLASFFFPVVIKSLVGRHLLSPPKLFPAYMNTLWRFKETNTIIWGRKEQEEPSAIKPLYFLPLCMTNTDSCCSSLHLSK